MPTHARWRDSAETVYGQFQKSIFKKNPRQYRDPDLKNNNHGLDT